MPLQNITCDNNKTKRQLTNVFNELQYRFEWCVLNDGGYVEG
jgi:hypothetical protein